MLEELLGPVEYRKLSELGETFSHLRLTRPAVEERLRRSLAHHGQMTPVIVARVGERHELIDGFKRVRAARKLPLMEHLSTRLLTAEPPQLKQFILLLNRSSTPVSPMEEAWIIRSLVREDGQTQLEIATSMGRHQSWVSRRLSLAERLSDEIQTDVRLGLATPATARALAGMPRGIQQEIWTAIRQEGFTSSQVKALAELCADARPEQRSLLLWHPRETLEDVLQTPSRPLRDSRLNEPAATWMLQMKQLQGLCRRLRSALEQSDYSTLKPTEQTLLGQQALLLSPILLALAQSLGRLAVPTVPVEASMPLRCDTPREPISKTS